MGVFRRRRSEPKAESSAAPYPAAATDGPQPVEFVGISQGSVDRADFSPYEFQTEGGVWVRLHDMSFVGLEYRPSERVLTLRFMYNDPAWTPEAAKFTPLAVFEFSSVRILQWEDDTTLPDTPREHRGQTSQFNYTRDRDLFCLDTIDTSLAFRARRLQVTLAPTEAPGR